MSYKDHTYTPYAVYLSDNDTWEPIVLEDNSFGATIMCVRPEDRDKYDESDYELPHRMAEDEDLPYFNLDLNSVIKFYLANNQHLIPSIQAQ